MGGGGGGGGSEVYLFDLNVRNGRKKCRLHILKIIYFYVNCIFAMNVILKKNQGECD